MAEHYHKLTLNVSDLGDRQFRGRGPSDDQDELATNITFDFGRALEILNVQPEAHDVIEGLEKVFNDDVWKLLACVHRQWTATNDFDECVELVVHVDKLEAEDVEQYARLFPKCKVKFVNGGKK